MATGFQRGSGRSADIWVELERLIDRFEEAWHSGTQPVIDEFLPPAGPERRALLIELVHADLERRLESGADVRVETYLDRYPELGEDRTAVVGLIAAERELRSGSVEEYLRRFPEFAEELSSRPNGMPEPARPPIRTDDQTPLPAATVALSTRELAPDTSRPTVPGYEIVEELGRGGMGVVYKARHLKLGRWVALKMILDGMHAGPEERARFRAEAEAVARLQHPNIVQVHEVGEHVGRPFLALEYVDGGSLAQRLQGAPLPPGEAADLLETLARAMHHAHSQGVVHRDLKPANVLLASGGREPKIADFGLAKQLGDGHTLTQTGAILGTPSYMAPEQLGGGKHVGPAADIYALGALLYELLTGRPPFRASTVLDTMEQVRTQEPVSPRRLQPKLPRDVEVICLKCLAKDPRQRYPSAQALADELNRFRAGLPIRARATPRWERAMKWVRRRPAIAGLLALVIGVASAGFIAVTWQWQQTKAGLAKAEANLYANRIALADQEWRANHVDRARQLLAECPPELRGWEWYYLSRLCQRELLSLPTGDALGVAFRPGAAQLAVASISEEAVSLWDLHDGHRLRTFSGTGPAVTFSADGKRLASATWKLGPAGELVPEQPCTVKIWDAESGQELCSLPGHAGSVLGLAFSPDGKRLATASIDRTVRVWDLSTNKEPLIFRRHTGWVESVAFNRDGRLIASADAKGPPLLWNSSTGAEVVSLSSAGPAKFERMQPYKGMSRTTGSPSGDQPIKLWDAERNQSILPLRGQLHELASVAFSPDGQRLAAGRGNTIQVWDPSNGREVLVLRGHADLVRGVVFNRDGSRLASASYDQGVKLWDLASGEEVFTLRGHTAPVNRVAFRADGLQLASTGWDGTTKVWDAVHGAEARVLRGHSSYVRGLAFAPDSSRLATAGADHLVKLWDPTNGQEVRTLRGHDQAVNSVAFLPDGSRLASAGYDHVVKLWYPACGAELRAFRGHEGEVYQVAFTRDGARLASASQDGGVRIWDATDGRELLVYRGHRGRVFSVAFARNGKLCASGGDDRLVHLWETGSGADHLVLAGHGSDVTQVVFSPDGRRVASASLDRTARVWDVATGREVLTLRGHAGGVTGVAFSADGRRLATASIDRTIRIWNAQGGQELLTLRGPSPEVLSVAFSPDGNWLAASGTDGNIHVWDATPVSNRVDTTLSTAK